jgi:drug/metabolite transporter (DMT)-like permease
MALLSSIVAYSCFEWALNTVSVGDTAILGYISTIFGIPFAFWILGEIPTFYALLGAVIIGTGVGVAEISAHFHKKKMLFGKR